MASWLEHLHHALRGQRPGDLLDTARSIALACLETMVHLVGVDPLPPNRYLVRIDIPLEIWRHRWVAKPREHVGWDALPAGRISIEWGTAWVKGGHSLLAEVPSIVVPAEKNVLINPAHRDLKKIVVKKVRRWVYDSRAGL